MFIVMSRKELVSLRSKRFLARFVKKAGTRAKKIRAITRLETLATQAKSWWDFYAYA